MHRFRCVNQNEPSSRRKQAALWPAGYDSEPSSPTFARQRPVRASKWSVSLREATSTATSAPGDIAFERLDSRRVGDNGVADDHGASTNETIGADTAIAAYRAVRRQEGVRSDAAVMADADTGPDDDVVGNRHVRIDKGAGHDKGARTRRRGRRDVGARVHQEWHRVAGLLDTHGHGASRCKIRIADGVDTDVLRRWVALANGPKRAEDMFPGMDVVDESRELMAAVRDETTNDAAKHL